MSGIPVWLLFMHEQEGEIRAETMTAMEPKKRVYHGTKMGGIGMVFFPYDELRMIGKLQTIRQQVVEAVPQ